MRPLSRGGRRGIVYRVVLHPPLIVVVVVRPFARKTNNQLQRDPIGDGRLMAVAAP